MVADTIIFNGRVITVNEKDELAEAVAVQGNKILAVGDNDEVKALAGPDTKMVDAGGNTVMPGFIDSHIHFGMYGLLGHGIINVDYSHAQSIADIQRLIEEDVAQKKPGEWIKLQGYDHNKLSDGRHPTTQDFDAVAPNNPVQCTRCCAHMGVYNTAALKIAGVEKPEQFAPGEVVSGPDGSLTGLLKESAHMFVSTKVEFSEGDLIDGLVNANNIMLSLGITSIHEAGCYGAHSFKAMQTASMKGLVDVRMYPMVFDMFGKESSIEFINDYIKTGVITGLGNEKYKIGPVKIMLDGSSSGPSSATFEPYSHDANLKGILVWQPEETEEMIMKAHKAGFQVTAHAIGDKAVDMMVTAIEKALAACPRKDHRHRIEHAGLTNPQLIDRIANAGIIPIPNPSFITINGRDYNRFYGDRVDYMFPLMSYLDKGVPAAIGSDAPVTHPNPMSSLYGALNRKDKKNNVETGPSQKIGIMDAIRMFTYNGAYASFEEQRKGSLEAGKLADITILSQDILETPTEDITNVVVEYTFVDGKLAYTRKK